MKKFLYRKCSHLALSASLSTAAVFFLCGFTLNEDILTQCEREHPNDFLARIVCNNRVEDENREIRAASCVSQETDKLIGGKANFDKFLNENADESNDFLIQNLRLLDYSPSLIDRGDQLEKPANNRLKVLVFSKKTKCDSKTAFLFNILLDETLKVDTLRVWAGYPPKYESRISELDWSRSSHIFDIEIAKRAKAEIKKKQDEKEKLQGELLKKQAAADVAAAQRALIIIMMGIISIVILIIFIYYKKNIINLLRTKIRKDLFRKKVERTVDSPKENLHVIETINQNEEKNNTQETKQEPQIKDREINEQINEIKEEQGHFKSSDSLLNFDFVDMAKFRDDYPFVNIDVPTKCMTQFIVECRWYKEKRGVYPGIKEQVIILSEIKNALIKF